MIICSKCETKNEEDAVYCIKCGTKLEVSREESWDKRMEKWGEDFGKRAEKEASNLGAILGIIIGVSMILVGIAWFSGIAVTRYFWPIIIIVFGLLVLAGVIYGLLRNRQPC